jgi:hypothetical protein
MEKEKLKELQEGLEAINILTERLINLAVIENKFLRKVEELEFKLAECSMIRSALIDNRERGLAINLECKKMMLTIKSSRLGRFLLKGGLK